MQSGPASGYARGLRRPMAVATPTWRLFSLVIRELISGSTSDRAPSNWNSFLPVAAGATPPDYGHTCPCVWHQHQHVLRTYACAHAQRLHAPAEGGAAAKVARTVSVRREPAARRAGWAWRPDATLCICIVHALSGGGGGESVVEARGQQAYHTCGLCLMQCEHYSRVFQLKKRPISTHNHNTPYVTFLGAFFFLLCVSLMLFFC